MMKKNNNSFFSFVGGLILIGILFYPIIGFAFIWIEGFIRYLLGSFMVVNEGVILIGVFLFISIIMIIIQIIVKIFKYLLWSKFKMDPRNSASISKANSKPNIYSTIAMSPGIKVGFYFLAILFIVIIVSGIIINN